MPMSPRSPRSAVHGCKRDRLAEGDFAAVDICGCGVMQLHLGALSLRLPPSAVSELVDTLSRALARHADDVAPALLARTRGQA